MQLIVSEGTLPSTTTVLVVGIDPETVPAQTIQTSIATINGLPASVFKNGNMEGSPMGCRRD